MRHSRFTQSYLPHTPSLEVTEAEMGRSVKPWATCQTIAQMNIPQADSAVQTSPVKSQPLGIVRRTLSEAKITHSIADAHQITIHRNVARRMQAARERGDQRLLRALEAELREVISI